MAVSLVFRILGLFWKGVRKVELPVSLVCGLAAVAVMIFGSTKGREKLVVKEQTLSFKNLPEEFDKLNRAFFTALSLKGISYERLLMSGNFGYTRFKAISQVLDAVFKDNAKNNELDTFKKEVLINFMNTTSLDIYRKWVDEGKKIPLKDIIEMGNQQKSVYLTYDQLKKIKK